MPTKVWIYEGRNSAARAYWRFADARAQQDTDNGGTLEELVLSHKDWELEWGGSEEEGWFYIDDGGSINLVEVE